MTGETSARSEVSLDIRTVLDGPKPQFFRYATEIATATVVASVELTPVFDHIFIDPKLIVADHKRSADRNGDFAINFHRFDSP